MKLMSFFRSALIGALLCGAGTVVSQTAQPFPEGSATVELQDGAYYQLSQSLALTGTAERCAITMASNATAVVELSNHAQLTLEGPALDLPETARLILMGNGTLNATAAASEQTNTLGRVLRLNEATTAGGISAQVPTEPFETTIETTAHLFNRGGTVSSADPAVNGKIGEAHAPLTELPVRADARFSGYWSTAAAQLVFDAEGNFTAPYWAMLDGSDLTALWALDETKVVPFAFEDPGEGFVEYLDDLVYYRVGASLEYKTGLVVETGSQVALELPEGVTLTADIAVPEGAQLYLIGPGTLASNGTMDGHVVLLNGATIAGHAIPAAEADGSPFPTRVTFDDTDGAGGPGTVTAQMNSCPAGLSQLPTRAGYLFRGYWSSPTGGTLGILPDGSINGGVWQFGEGTTLYARWMKTPDFGEECPIVPGSELKDGVYYTVSESMTITAPIGVSALKVAANATVVLDVREGVALTLVGGAAEGTAGAGAGLEIPASSKLIVTGLGTLDATGGRAARGADGQKGVTASLVDETSALTGAGGNGGAGGGGAGAGLGGRGGAGTSGGAGAAALTIASEATQDQVGVAGSAGANGTNGGAMGKVWIMGGVTVRPTAGGAGGDGDTGSTGDPLRFGGFLLGGGAGGQGGEGGRAAASIGGGGAGGAGGGGGGCGGALLTEGKEPSAPGATGSRGASGAGGTYEGAYASSAATVIGAAPEALSAVPTMGITTRVKLNPHNEGAVREVSYTIGTTGISFASQLPSMTGRTFGGYWTSADGGFMLIDPTGKLVDGAWCFPQGLELHAHWAIVSNNAKEMPVSSGSTLKDGTYYRVSGSTTINGYSAQSALSVDSGATVAIEVPDGVTLKLNGGDASYRFSAGAGLYVPSNAKVILLGAGTLEAKGGKAGRGSSGSNGGNAKKDGRDCWAGSGGAGGGGGGGAGAGIGGCGGHGGSGGNTKDGRFSGDYYPNYDGYDGNSGSSGGSGATMGGVYVVGHAIVKATGGSGNSYYGSGANMGDRINDTYAWSSAMDYGVGGGGGGAGGGSGYPGSAIGGGGAGGGGGGGGGSGGIDSVTAGYWVAGATGEGGYAGSGYSSGTRGSPSYRYGSNHGEHGGGGGAGGSSGSQGGAGTLQAVSSASVSGRTPSAMIAFDSGIKSGVSLYPQNGVDNAVEFTANLAATVDKLPKTLIPTREGYLFVGFYTGLNGTGELIFSGTGQYQRKVWDLSDGTNLYAHWKSAAEYLTVRVATDEQPIFVEEGVLSSESPHSLRTALKVMELYPSLKAQDGSRAITFDVNASDLYLASPLTVAAGTEPFAIDGLNNGQGLRLKRSSSGFAGEAFLKTAGRGLVLKNLMFSGTADKVCVSVDGGDCEIDNCVFEGALTGVAWKGTGTASCRITRTTFANGTKLGVDATADGGDVLALTVDHCAFDVCASHAIRTGATVATTLSNSLVHKSALTCAGGLNETNNLKADDTAATFGSSSSQLVTPVTHPYRKLLWEEALWKYGNGAISPVKIDFEPVKLSLVHDEPIWVGTDRAPTYDYSIPVGYETDALPALDHPLPRWNGYVFLGYFRESDGLQYYAADGTPMTHSPAVPYGSTVRLKPRWQETSALLTVTTTVDAENEYDGRITLRDAIRAIGGFPELVNEAGARTVVFDIDADHPTITLKTSLAVPEGANGFILDGENKGRGLVISGKDGTFETAMLKSAATSLTLENLALVEANKASAVVQDKGDLIVRNCRFENNVSLSNGVAIWWGGAPETKCDISYSTFRRNRCSSTSRDVGGTVYLSRASSAYPSARIVHCTFAENNVHVGGAFVATSYVALDIGSLLVYGNTAKYDFQDNNGQQVFVTDDKTLSGTKAAEGLGTEAVQTTNTVAHTYRKLLWEEHLYKYGHGNCSAVDLDYEPVKMTVAHPWPVRVGTVYTPTNTINVAVDDYSSPLPEIPAPTWNGHALDGYFRKGKQNDNWPYYDGDCKPHDQSPNPQVPFGAVVTIEPRWSATDALFVVTTGEDGENLVNEKITLRDATRGFSEYDYVPTDKGQRVITFDIETEHAPVTLEDPIEWKAGYPADFAIDGINGGRGVTILPVTGAKTRFFRFPKATKAVTFENLTFKDACAEGGSGPGDGGAICSFTPITLHNCRFEGNHACYGGGVYTESTTLFCRDCTFVKNSVSGESASYGGAIAAKQSAVTLYNVTCISNVSNEAGSAIAMKKPSKHIELVNVTAVGNESKLSATYGSAIQTFEESGTTSGWSATFRNVLSADNVRKKGPNCDFGYSLGTKYPFVVDRCAYLNSASSAYPLVWKSLQTTFETNGVTHTLVYPHPRGAAYERGALPTPPQPTVDITGKAQARPSIGSFWPKYEPFSRTVTTPRDVVDPCDGVVSLREAFLYSTSALVDPDANDVYAIDVADALYGAEGVAVLVLDDPTRWPVVLDDGRSYSVNGTEDRRTLRLAPQAKMVDLFKVTDGTQLALNRLQVDGSGATDATGGTVALSAGGKLVIDHSAFTGYACDGATLVGATSGTVSVVNSSFADNALASSGNSAGRIVDVKDSASGRLVSCTVARNSGGEAAVTVSGTGGLLLANVTVCENKMRTAAVSAASANHTNLLVLVNCALLANSTASGPGDLEGSSSTSSAVKIYATIYGKALNEGKIDRTDFQSDSAFDVCFPKAGRTVSVCGVPMVAYEPQRKSDAETYGAFVYTDASGENVAYLKEWGDWDYKPVWGDKNKATSLVRRDIADIEIENHAACGSRTALRDAEEFDPDNMLVNNPVDEKDTAFNLYDNKLSLREAVDWLEKHPTTRTVDGGARIVFSDAFFGGQEAETVKAVMRQIEVTSFTNGVLTISGHATKTVTLDGVGKHRLFYIAPNNQVAFDNLNFAHGYGEAAGASRAARTNVGGAIFNEGRVSVSNCVFTANSAGGGSAFGGYSDGGAICTGTGAETFVTRASFLDNKASRGGAIHTRKDGKTVVTFATLTGNRATGSAEGTRGGAVNAEIGSTTILLNTTITANHSDGEAGGVALSGDEPVAAKPYVYLLSSVVVGNTAKFEEGADLAICGALEKGYEGQMKLAMSSVGRRAKNDDDGRWSDLEGVVKNANPVDLFASVKEDGTPEPMTMRCGSVDQTIFPLIAEKDVGGAYVFADAACKYIGYAASATATKKAVFLGTSTYVQRVTSVLAVDQLGEDFATTGPVKGATARREFPDVPPPPPEEEDPLKVKVATQEALEQAVALAAASPTLASNGVLTVSFDGPMTITLDKAIELTTFTTLALRFKGPVALKGAGANRLFLLNEGNRLQLDGVTLENGYDTGVGGAIYGESAFLWATNCVFSNNIAADAEVGCGFGGAVAFAYDDSAMTFEDCTFTGNKAVNGDGQSIYHDDINLVLRNCTFSGAIEDEVYEAPRTKVEKADGGIVYFDTVAAAVREARTGDVIVSLSDDNPPIPEEFAKDPTKLTAYSVKSLPSGGFMMALDAEKATPVLDEAATIDLADPLVVRMVPSNVKPLLWYGIGASATPGGAYEVSTWVQADAEGNLPKALTAPKAGAAAFYRVVVTDAP